MKKLVVPVLAAFVAGSIAALAAVTIPTSIGDIVFPFTAPQPNATPPVPGLINNTYFQMTSQPAPTIASGACGTTNNGTIAAGSTNQAGLVQIGAAATVTCTVSFTAPLPPTAPDACNLTPANAAAAAQGTTVARLSSVTQTGFVITGTALANANYYYTCF